MTDALATLKGLLDDDSADTDDIRDAAIRAVNRFDASIAAHDGWRPYSRRPSSDPETRAEAERLGNLGVERHAEYRGRLRRQISDSIAEILITETRTSDGDPTPRDGQGEQPNAPARATAWRIKLRISGPSVHLKTNGRSFHDAEMIGAQRLAEL